MTEILEIFAKCTTCGANGIKIRQIQKWANENNIMMAVHKTGDGRHEPSNIRHFGYLDRAGLPQNYHTGIVVEDTHKITKLKDWQLPHA